MVHPQTDDTESAHDHIVFLQESADWITVRSDLPSYDDPDSCAAIATPFSANLHTEVMGIACFDDVQLNSQGYPVKP